MLGIKFRIIKQSERGSELVKDTVPIHLNMPWDIKDPKGFDLFTRRYQQLKEEFPLENHQIIVILEQVIPCTYEPMSQLLPDDIKAMVKKMDGLMRKGILQE